MTILEEVQALEAKKKARISELVVERTNLIADTASRLKAIAAELAALGHKRARKAKAEWRKRMEEQVAK